MKSKKLSDVKNKPLPQVLFAKWDGTSNETFLNASADVDDLLETGASQRIGYYQLKEIKKGSLKPHFD